MDDDANERAAYESWRDWREVWVRDRLERSEKVMRVACETGKPVFFGVFYTPDGEYQLTLTAVKKG